MAKRPGRVSKPRGSTEESGILLASQPALAAVIDIGATSVRLAIGEATGAGNLRIVDSAAVPVSLGMDSFVLGRIERKTISAAVQALRMYREKLAEYRIDNPGQIRVVATSAVREARNRLEFIDRIYNLTGFEVEPFDEADVHRVTYLGVSSVFDRHPELADGRTLAIEVGGGTTEVQLLQARDVVFSNTFRLGALRMRRTLEAYRTPTDRVREIMESEIERVAKRIERESGDTPIERLLVMGGDIRLAARILRRDQESSRVDPIETAELCELVESVWPMSADQLVAKYHLGIADAESLAPALLAYAYLANRFQRSQVFVADTNLREGVLLDIAGGGVSVKIRPQILNSVEAIATKYGVDLAHARHVRKLAESLFGELADDSGLTDNCLLILQVAALLHEIGLFVSSRSYHKHTMYLIRSSEFFGISARNLQLAALVARYHRRASPQPQHELYSTLDRKDRGTVCKLAAILRVAKALDVARQRKVSGFQTTRVGQNLVLDVGAVNDLALENLELQLGGSLFEDTFGLNVVLRSENR